MINININKKLSQGEKEINLKLDISISEGDFIAISGKSGSGKTTFLRILAGLQSANGTIKVHQIFWLNDKKSLCVQKRNIGFVFQDYALFSNMNIYENLLYVKNNKDLANRLLNITELYNMKNRDVNSLSGGEKQRVSLCRAMMNNPKILLLDEPFNALDINMRLKLQDELILLHKEFKMTTIMVSHDTSEIYRLASRVLILENGNIIKDGNPKDIFFHSNNTDNFVFEAKIIDIKKIDNHHIISISIAFQLLEIQVSNEEAKNMYISKSISVTTKKFGTKIITNKYN
jgi:molybdate transport system ATP-binding protein